MAPRSGQAEVAGFTASRNQFDAQHRCLGRDGHVVGGHGDGPHVRGGPGGFDKHVYRRAHRVGDGFLLIATRIGNRAVLDAFGHEADKLVGHRQARRSADRSTQGARHAALLLAGGQFLLVDGIVLWPEIAEITPKRDRIAGRIGRDRQAVAVACAGHGDLRPVADLGLCVEFSDQHRRRNGHAQLLAPRKGLRPEVEKVPAQPEIAVQMGRDGADGCNCRTAHAGRRGPSRRVVEIILRPEVHRKLVDERGETLPLMFDDGTDGHVLHPVGGLEVRRTQRVIQRNPDIDAPKPQRVDAVLCR